VRDFAHCNGNELANHRFAELIANTASGPEVEPRDLLPGFAKWTWDDSIL